MKKNIIWIIALAVVLILVGVFFYAEDQAGKIARNNGSSNSAANQPANNGSASASSTLPSESSGIIHPSFTEFDSVAIDETGWQTFVNELYGFQISAPKSWSITSSADNGSLENGGELYLRPSDYSDQFYAPVGVTATIDNSSVNDWLQQSRTRVEGNHENFIEINIPTSDGAYAETVAGGAYAYNVKKGDKIFRFDILDGPNDLLKQAAMMKAIVETFRFTK